MRFRALILTASALLASYLCSCKTPNLDSGTRGYILEGSAYLWPKATASVCWENPRAETAEIRAKIQEAVSREYQRAGFTFTGWGICLTQSRGIRINELLPTNFRDRVASVRAYGRRLDGLIAGVALTFDYNGLLAIAAKMNRPMYCQSDAENCAVISALHEFGHALGLAHEADRDDSPCHELSPGGGGGTAEGFVPVDSYDRDSIMNYCMNALGEAFSVEPRLSPGDIETIKKLYSSDPVTFSREEACRKDGHSWITEEFKACCLRQANSPEASDEKKPYKFCDEGGVSVGSTSPTTQSTKILFVAVSASPFPQSGFAFLNCDEGVYPGKIYSKSPTEATYAFVIKYKRQAHYPFFHCRALEMTDQEAVENSTMIGRV